MENPARMRRGSRVSHVLTCYLEYFLFLRSWNSASMVIPARDAVLPRLG